MEWAESNKSYAILRCTKTKHANMLMDNGTIMFNTARAWAEMERKNGKGQGDLYEGVYATCGLYDIPSIKEYYNKYEDVEPENDGKLVYFKRSSVIDMPAFCFFLLKQSLFNRPVKEGIQKLETIIPGRYFRDFADGLNKDKAMKLKEEDRPSVVMVWDIDKFIKMIKIKLISMGVKESQILIKAINYHDKQVPFYCPATSPKELLLKDKSFEYQTEGRIVINTRNKKLLNTLVRKPIDIGSVKEFSVQSNEYFQEGVRVEMRADIFQCD